MICLGVIGRNVMSGGYFEKCMNADAGSTRCNPIQFKSIGLSGAEEAVCMGGVGQRGVQKAREKANAKGYVLGRGILSGRFNNSGSKSRGCAAKSCAFLC